MQVRVLSIKRLYIFLLILFTSGFLLLTDNKEAGIPYLRELIILIILTHTTYRLVISGWYRHTQHEFFILGLTLFFILGSSLLAYIAWGQPLHYGILEERRTFAYLLFFPIFWALLLRHITLEDIVKFIIYGFIFSSLLGYLYYFNIIPDNTSPSFAVDFRGDQVSFDPRAGTRYLIGTTWMTAIFIYSLYKVRENMYSINQEFYIFLGLAIYIVAYLWFVVQTRGTMLWFAIYSLFVFRKHLLFFIDKSLIIIPLLIVLAFILQDFLLAQVEKFILLFEEATQSLGPRVREVTSAIIYQEISDNYYLGKGALSLQWNGGFSNIYNPNFYLSDVGLSGIYYRFGFFAFLLIPIYYFFVINNSVKVFKENLFIKANLLTLVTFIFSISYGASFAYNGFRISILLAMIAYISYLVQNNYFAVKRHKKT